MFGLVVLDEHGTHTCNDAVMAVSKHYGIRYSDIILLINDTTNASIVTG